MQSESWVHFIPIGHPPAASAAVGITIDVTSGTLIAVAATAAVRRNIARREVPGP